MALLEILCRNKLSNAKKSCWFEQGMMGSINFCFPGFSTKKIAAIKVNMRLKGHVLRLNKKPLALTKKS